jgi:hypothetical protein
MKKPRLQELESAESDGGATRQTVTAERREQRMAAHSMPVRRQRLLMVCSHIVQYSSPVFQKLGQDARIQILFAKDECTTALFLVEEGRNMLT